MNDPALRQNAFRQAAAVAAMAALLLQLTACSTTPEPQAVAPLSPEAALVAKAIAGMPHVARGGSAIRRPFFVTFHAAGQRTTASGILEYYAPRDFRITAATELGALLFDGRIDWAGVHVLRHLNGLDAGVVETIISDLSRAFDLPEDLEGLSVDKEKMTLRKKRGDGHATAWTFNRVDGRLMQIDVEMALFDTLHIEFKGYSSTGWPAELRVQRKARLYDISLSFTDSH